jgi:hypothetical protein
MSLIGGKRKVNKSLKAWVAFVKRVQKEEKLSYKDAIHRAKVRKDKGEKWMKGGASPDGLTTTPNVTAKTNTIPMDVEENETIVEDEQGTPIEVDDEVVETPEDVDLADTTIGEQMNTATYGGKLRRTMRKRSARRGKARTARKSRGRSRGRGRGRQ